MSIQGKKIAMLKHACEVAQSVINNALHNYKNPILLELGLCHIKAQARFRRNLIKSTPADRFNDDGTLKPAPELQHLENEYIPRETKNFEANV